MPKRRTLKLATFNVNGINTRLANLLSWLEEAKPDVVALQELKATDGAFPVQALEVAGYGAIWHGQQSWNGVVVAGLYLPNGNPQPGPKFDYKLAWMKRLEQHAKTLVALPHPVALMGDFNVIPTDLDVYDPKSWKKNALIQPESREAFGRLVGQGWTDAVREAFGEERIYTFWDHFRQHAERDRGLRIDHILLNPVLAEGLVEAGVDQWVRLEERASDHAPTWVTVRV
ncbi:exodeoxyribonuclease III [Pseudoxanthomonas sp. UC19_8]|uniref:exodeoxyribonuclease III n=1 Tax=Pseudoxanthomonas sp. UC19_8 TaxID=3350175 RepID=UPI0036D368B8